MQKSDYSEYRIGNDWYRGQWSIAPQVEHDTLKVLCYNSKETFEFRTDNDRIEFEIEPNTTKSFMSRWTITLMLTQLLKELLLSQPS